MDIHYKEVSTFARCPYQWYKRFVIGADTDRGENIVEGAVWDDVVAKYLDTRSYSQALEPYSEVYKAYMIGYTYTGPKDLLLIPHLLPHFARWFETTGLAPVETHKELRVEIEPDLYLCGTVDALLEDGLHRPVVGEWKFLSQIRTDHLLMDLQGRLYALLATELFGPPITLVYGLTRKQSPATARTPVVAGYEVTHPEQVLWHTAKDVSQWVTQMSEIRLGLRRAVRNANPLSWMGCFCGVSNECQSEMLQVGE